MKSPKRRNIISLLSLLFTWPFIILHEKFWPSENQKSGRKWSHKRDEIGVRRIGTFPFRLPPRRLLSAYDLVKTRLSESEEEAEG